MGREAVTTATWQGEVAAVKALLEGTEIILRGAIRARLPLAGVTAVKVDGDNLSLLTDGLPLRLGLGAAEAAKWADKIAAGPVSLADKLGLKGAARARVLGPWTDDGPLSVALNGRVTDGKADMLVAVCTTLPDFDRAVFIASESAVPVWFVYPKGRGAVTDTMVRAHMRGLGWKDTKSCAVSDRLTATRYQR
jgi:hypothetical protein